MAKYYVVETSCEGEVVGCECTLDDAHDLARSFNFGPHDYQILCLDVRLTRDNVRRLLGGLGGYADKVEWVKWVRP